MYVICYIDRTGESNDIDRIEGSNDSDQTRGSNKLYQTGGSNELWDWRVLLRHIDQRIIPCYSLEWHYVLYVYFEELTKHLCLPCYVICVSGTSEDRGKA